MKNKSVKNSKARIRSFFKELIKVYKSKNYEEEIVKLDHPKTGVPTFQLRFVKQGEDCKYYRILLDDTRLN